MKLTDEYLKEALVTRFATTPYYIVEEWQLKDKEGHLTSVLNLLRAKFLSMEINRSNLIITMLIKKGNKKEAIKLKEKVKNNKEKLLTVLNKKGYLSDKDFERKENEIKR